MSLPNILRSAVSPIREISTREFQLAVLACITLAAVNAVVVSYRVGYADGHIAGLHQCYGPQQQDVFYDLIRLKIELALALAAISLSFKRVIGLCASLLATLFVLWRFALWYFDTRRWLHELNVDDFSKLPIPSEWPHFAGLIFATPWDFLLLLFTATLLVWQTKILFTVIVSRTKQS